MFSHAYFHHPALFRDFEVSIFMFLFRDRCRCLFHSYFHFFLQNETHLCKRFTRFVTKYDLMSRDNLIVPIFEEDGEEDPYVISTNDEFSEESYS